MHLLTEKTINIKRPISAVFEYVANMEKFGEWFPGVVLIESANGLDHGQVGKEYLETVSVPLRGTRKIRLAVREVRGNRFFATEGKFPPLMPRMEISLSEAEMNSCELTWRIFSRNNNLIVRHALLPLARRVMRKRAESGVAALKKRLEGDTASHAGATG
ncbi:MAG: polyketide cyclase [Burkholderiales bacterium RIFCSPLOWO2_02_FULL_57_36]|nr:MAG: polyketide cyclase [Burkholderiales bacterium RIFCSPLOWO2_02_FULL_57_36]